MTGPYRFGRKSLERRMTCSSPLRRVLDRALLHMDLTVLCGERTAEEQQACLDVDPPTTTLAWPDSSHNIGPDAPDEWSHAVDVAPWIGRMLTSRGLTIDGHIPWEDKAVFERMADLIFAVAADEGVKLRWGGAWNGTRNNTPGGVETQLDDLPHFEEVPDD